MCSSLSFLQMFFRVGESTSSGTNHSSGMDRTGTALEHQYSGDESCIEYSDSISRQSSGSRYCSDVRQHFCGGICQQMGDRIQISVSVDT